MDDEDDDMSESVFPIPDGHEVTMMTSRSKSIFDDFANGFIPDEI